MAGSDRVIRNMQNWLERTKAQIYALAEAYSAQMEAYAKPNAPWTDRTSHARQNLFGYVRETEEQIQARIAHGEEYGVYLELLRQGKYAILRPTVNRFFGDFIRDVKRVINAR